MAFSELQYVSEPWDEAVACIFHLQIMPLAILSRHGPCDNLRLEYWNTGILEYID